MSENEGKIKIEKSEKVIPDAHEVELEIKKATKRKYLFGAIAFLGLLDFVTRALMDSSGGVVLHFLVWIGFRSASLIGFIKVFIIDLVLIWIIVFGYYTTKINRLNLKLKEDN